MGQNHFFGFLGVCIFWEGFWSYLGNEKNYRRSAGLITTGFFRAFQLPMWVTPEGHEGQSQEPKRPPTRSQAL